MPYGDGTVGIVISIHASRGGSDAVQPYQGREGTISIHASRGGSDIIKVRWVNRSVISIHASRGGSDPPITAFEPFTPNFNPRFPRGKRHSGAIQVFNNTEFQSTLPAGEATHSHFPVAGILTISIHASRGGSDPGRRRVKEVQAIFQSTLPAGEATRRPGRTGTLF